MLAIVDANVVFSALVGKGNTYKVFESNKVFGFFEFIAPEYMLSEIDEKSDRLLSLTHLEREELDDAYSFIKAQISIISFAEFSDKMHEAMKLNLEDAPYLALAMKLSCPIISGDKQLRQQPIVEVIPPAKALEMIRSSKAP